MGPERRTPGPQPTSSMPIMQGFEAHLGRSAFDPIPHSIGHSFPPPPLRLLLFLYSLVSSFFFATIILPGTNKNNNNKIRKKKQINDHVIP